MNPAVFWARWRSVLALAYAVMREIFDENAYQRFLAREHLQPSQSSYARFWQRDREGTRPRPRCC
jgi:hypothetical protein